MRFYAVTRVRWAAQLARTLLAQLRGFGATGANDAAEAVDDAEVVQPMGLRATPVVRDSLEVVAVELPDQRVALFLVDKSRQAGAVEPEAGGALLHSLAAQACVVYCRASGAIELTAATGQDVVCNGGTLKVARDTDPIRIGTLAGTAGPYPVLFTFTPEDHAGAPQPPVVGTPAGVELAGVISNAGCAPHVKA